MKAVAICLCAVACLSGPVQAQTTPSKGCSLALAFALDVSSSVDETEHQLQRAGLASALQDPEVQTAILARAAPVTLAAYEWSGEWRQSLLTGWTRIETEADLAAFAASVLSPARGETGFPTAIGAAVGYGANLLQQVPNCERQVLDVSGDGVNNDGYPPKIAYRHFPIAGVTINGLVIETPGSDVVDYYVKEVIRGPGAFVEVAHGFKDYERAMKLKLLRELQSQQFASR